MVLNSLKEQEQFSGPLYRSAIPSMVPLLNITETATFTALAKPVPICGPVASTGFNCGISQSSTELICYVFLLLLGT